MCSPVDFPGLIPTLIIVWAAAALATFAEIGIAAYRARLPARPILFGLFRFLGFGSMLTVFGIAQHASFLGAMSQTVYVFTIFVAAVAVAGTALVVRLTVPAKS